MSPPRRRRGFVLVVVLVFALLLSASVATLTRHAVVDGMIVRNRDRAAQAEALARGGLRLAIALVLEDRLRELREETLPIEGGDDLWAAVASVETQTDDGGTLRLRVEDESARFNLNALVPGGEPLDFAEEYLVEVLSHVIEQMPGLPEEKAYDREELARSLIDYLDADDVRVGGGPEDDVYQRQDPPYRAANRALLSVDELRRVEGFDAKLVEELRHYVTVYPYTGASGMNPNTAPPHVLGLLRLCESTCRLAPEDDVRAVLRARQEQPILCGADGCEELNEGLGGAEIRPPPSSESDVFRVRAEAAVGDIRRTLEAVVDRSDPTAPLLLSWQMR